MEPLVVVVGSTAIAFTRPGCHAVVVAAGTTRHATGRRPERGEGVGIEDERRIRAEAGPHSRRNGTSYHRILGDGPPHPRRVELARRVGEAVDPLRLDPAQVFRFLAGHDHVAWRRRLGAAQQCGRHSCDRENGEQRRD